MGSSAKNDKLELVKILAIMVVSFALGFALVILFLKPTPPSTGDTGDDRPEEQPTPQPALPAAPAAPAAASAPPSSADTAILSPAPSPAAPGSGYAGDGYAPPPIGAEPAAPVAPDTQADEGSARPGVPPGKTPEGVSIDGAAFYLKCWDAAGVEIPGTSCDRLEVLEKRFSTRLYAVAKCKVDAVGEKAEGKLSVGMEADFDAKSVRFWIGASSTFENTGKIAGCLRDSLAGLPIDEIPHKQNRYRLFHTVLFGKQAKRAVADKPQQPDAQAQPKAPKGKGKVAKVIKDHVRVRRTPQDGEIIGKIGKDNEVRVLEKKQGWCHVVTPNGKEGWMICDSLAP